MQSLPRHDKLATQPRRSGAPVPRSEVQSSPANWASPGGRPDVANRTASAACSAPSTLTEKNPSSTPMPVKIDDVRRQAPMADGLRESGRTALTVAPCASPALRTVTTGTPDARRRSARPTVSLGGDSGSSTRDGHHRPLSAPGTAIPALLSSALASAQTAGFEPAGAEPDQNSLVPIGHSGNLSIAFPSPFFLRMSRAGNLLSF